MRSTEFLRRLILLAGVVTAAAMAVWPAQAVWRVGTADFAKIQKRNIERFGHDLKTVSAEAGLEKTPEIAGGDEGALEAFVAKETEGRLCEVSGAAWRKFFDDVEGTLGGASRVLARRLEDSDRPTFLYFAAADEPIAGLRTRIGDGQPFAYIKLSDGAAPRYLGVTFQRSGDAMRHAPNFIAFPWRAGAVWSFLGALAFYCFLPRRRPAPEEFRYSQIRGAIVPDWLGTVMAAVFFALPILIIASNASPSRPWGLLDFADGWGILTLFMWFMALGGVAIVIVALWYATFSLAALGDRIRRVTLTRSEEYLYADMECVEATSWTLPTWLKWVMIGAGMLNRRNLGTMILGATRSMNGIQIRCRDGRRFNVWFDGCAQIMKPFVSAHIRCLNLPGKLLEILRLRGVRIAPEVTEAMAQSETPAVPPRTPSALRGTVWAASCFVLVGGAALALAAWPKAERRVVPPAPEISPEIHARQNQVLKEMEKLQPLMKAAEESVKAADADSRAAAIRKFDDLMGRFQQLQKQYEELDKIKYVPATRP